jgi:hypothetical protein
MIGQLNLTLWAWIESWRGLRKGALWPPFLLLFAVNALGLLVLTEFHRPLVAWFMVPVLRTAGGAGVLHYPNIFLGLPELFGRVNVVLDLLLGAWVFGTAWIITWTLATGGEPQGSWREAGRNYFKLIVLRLPISVLPILLSLLLPMVVPAREGGGYGPTAQRVLRFGSFFVGVLVESALLFGPAALLLGKRSVKGAFAETFRMLGRAPLAILLVVFAPNCMNLIVDYAVRRRETIAFKMAPEWVGVVELAAIGAYTLASFFVISAGVRIWGARGASPEGGR